MASFRLTRPPACVLIVSPPRTDSYICKHFQNTSMALLTPTSSLRLLPMPRLSMPSSGDFYGLGQTRKRELVKACGVLGVEEVSAGADTVPFDLLGTSRKLPHSALSEEGRRTVCVQRFSGLSRAKRNCCVGVSGILGTGPRSSTFTNRHDNVWCHLARDSET